MEEERYCKKCKMKMKGKHVSAWIEIRSNGRLIGSMKPPSRDWGSLALKEAMKKISPNLNPEMFYVDRERDVVQKLDPKVVLA